MGENLTGKLCAFLAGLDALPEADRLDVRYKTLDYLGCAIAALTCPAADMAAEMVRQAGGSPQAAGIGLGQRTSAQNAAFLNGILSHALEYDDTNKIAITHPGAPVISAALAAAEARDASIKEYALAVAAGYEAMIRLGGAVNPSHYTYWHTTGTCGTFAAAAAAGRLMGLDAAGLERAMGIAATMAGGLVCAFGTQAKLVTVGSAARSGLTAAELAWRGFTAPEDAFASPKGYARAAGGEEDLSFMVPQPGDKLLLEDAYYKMHASCGHTHSALDALQALLSAHPVTADQVERVEVAVYRTAWELCRAYQVETDLKAKFSLPFCLASMLRYGRVTLAEFSPEALASRETAALAAKIAVTEEPSFTAVYPRLRTERVRLILADGRTLEKSVDLPEGKPPYPRLEEKFYALAEMAISHEDAKKILDQVLSLPEEAPVRKIGDLVYDVRRK